MNCYVRAFKLLNLRKRITTFQRSFIRSYSLCGETTTTLFSRQYNEKRNLTFESQTFVKEDQRWLKETFKKGEIPRLLEEFDKLPVKYQEGLLDLCCRKGDRENALYVFRRLLESQGNEERFFSRYASFLASYETHENLYKFFTSIPPEVKLRPRFLIGILEQYASRNWAEEGFQFYRALITPNMLTADLLASLFNFFKGSLVDEYADKILRITMSDAHYNELFTRVVATALSKFFSSGAHFGHSWSVEHSVPDLGKCTRCGILLKPNHFKDADREILYSYVRNVLLKCIGSSALTLFDDFLNGISPDTVVDGPNVGYLFGRQLSRATQHSYFSKAGLNWVVKHLQWTGRRPVVLLRSHLAKSYCKTSDPLPNVYVVPNSVHDDLFWLYASLKRPCDVVTHDLMRDVRMKLPVTYRSLFLKWQRAHTICVQLKGTSFTFKHPPNYELSPQHHEEMGCYHFPVAPFELGVEYSTPVPRVWLCVVPK
ncbi:uncharacterized protein LOC135119662 isoform X2 [Zophobas morio]|uniref:uncharacterized protein LOC135119662 isoform X2 n=1 Tax=Zophobas morio TaxID=2755281 RepID=UPI003082922E